MNVFVGWSFDVKECCQLGPYVLADNLTLQRNPFSWTRFYDVLFVDNPVGTGYSYVHPAPNVPLFKMKEKELMTLISLPTIEKRVADYDQSEDDTELLFSISSNAMKMQSSSDHDDHDDGPFKQGYVTNQAGVASDMLAFLHKFYENFPEKRKADLYIATESYGGKSNFVEIKSQLQENMLQP